MANAVSKARKAANYLENREIRILAAREYRKNNKEKIKSARAEKYAKNKESILAINAEWRRNNPDYCNEYWAKYRATFPEKVKSSKKRYSVENKEVIAERGKSWADQNREHLKAYAKKYYADNYDRYLAHVAQRRAAKINSTPMWDSDLTRFVMTEAANLVRTRKNCTGVSWHVDHAVPLQGKLVCGLHVWNNLQVIPALMNLQKHNKFSII